MKRACEYASEQAGKKQKTPPRVVCVTGASGFLGSHVVREFVEAGYRVRGTVRSVQNTTKTDHLTTLFPEVELFEADLLVPGSFTAAFEGCSIVCHVASPFLGSVSDAQTQLIDPALKGTTNVMDTAVACGVQRVVVTSSCAAVQTQDTFRHPEKYINRVFTEDDWNEASTLKEGAYRLSKYLAEKKAWEYAEQIEVCTINPAFILGPSLSSRIDSESVCKMIDVMKGRPVGPWCFGINDVRDCARAHFKAATVPEAVNNRFIISSIDGFDLLQIAGFLRSVVHDKPSVTLPTEMTGVVTYRPFYDNSRARNILGINLRPVGVTAVDMFNKILDDGLMELRTTG